MGGGCGDERNDEEIARKCRVCGGSRRLYIFLLGLKFTGFYLFIYLTASWG